ncbi:MAG: NAD(P)-dependent oxidoreductase [Streptosporangiaceae bacterium]
MEAEQDVQGPVYGFIGLGQMGGPMAAHAPAAVVYDVSPEAVESLVAKGAKAAADPAEVAAAADVISVMVRDDAQVDAVFAAMREALRPGTVLAVHSTIAPRTAEELAERARPLGVDVVDAPVSGSVFGAIAGTLAVMVGGSAEAFARVEEPFSSWSGLVLHVGPAGAGTRAKLARNILQYAGFAAAAEAQRLAEAAGISLRRFGRIVRHSDSVSGGPGSVILRPTTAPMESDDPLYDAMRHALALGEKDLALAFEMAAELGVDLPLTRLAAPLLAEALGVPEEQS